MGPLKAFSALSGTMLLVACSATEEGPMSGTALGSTLGVPVVAEAPPPPNSVRSVGGGLFGAPAPPFGQPRGSAAGATSTETGFQRSRSTERVTVDGDGTVRTTRTTTTVGFNPERAGAALERIAGLAVAGGGFGGVWRMQSSSTGHICSIYLEGAGEDLSGPASVIDCGPTSVLAGLSAWSYDNQVLTLRMQGRGSIGFSRQGPNRFDGSATWGFITTRLALFR